MNKLIKYLNFIIFTIIVIVFFLTNTQKNISTNITTILPDGENKELLKEFENFHNTKLLFIGYKDIDGLEELKKIEKNILKNKNIKKLTKNDIIKEYEKRYYYLNNKLDIQRLEKLDIKKELEILYEKIVASPFSFQLDRKDPLKIFHQNSSFKTPYLKIKDYGYITILQIDNSIDTMQKNQNIYDFTKSFQTQNKNLELFSTLFYYVQSQEKIKNDTNTIIFIAIFILIVLYLIILKDIKLLINTLLTLSSSVLFALILTTMIFKELSIFSAIFGISISTIAIDYMFHNYMHGYYEDRKTINKDVFYGMFTTIGAFFILSFVEFKLIKELAYLASFSLLFSYLQFSFIYPKLGFISRKSDWRYGNKFFIRPIYISIIACLIICFSFFHIKFDLDIKNLDVENSELQQLERFFTTQIDDDKKIAVLISGNSLEELVENGDNLIKKYPNSITNLTKIPLKKDYERLEQYNFNRLNQELNTIATELGFRENIFQKSYKVEDKTFHYSLETLQKFGISKYKDRYISYAIISEKNYKEIVEESYIKSLSIKELFQNDLKKSLKSLQVLAIFAIIFILFMLYLAVKENFFKAINYILFPISFILLFSYFVEFNILHIFMMIVIVSIGIDYGIYMNSSIVNIQTKKAIFYSLLSTFTGFGVLIFSSLNALFSIGVVAVIGIIAIMILLLVEDKFKEEKR